MALFEAAESIRPSFAESHPPRLFSAINKQTSLHGEIFQGSYRPELFYKVEADDCKGMFKSECIRLSGDNRMLFTGALTGL